MPECAFETGAGEGVEEEGGCARCRAVEGIGEVVADREGEIVERGWGRGSGRKVWHVFCFGLRCILRVVGYG